MPIASLVVSTETACTSAVQAALNELPGVVEVEPRQDELIVITETRSMSDDKKTFAAIQAIPDVKESHLVYLNFEDLEESS